MQLSGKLKTYTRRESGMTLLETLVALAVLGTIAVVFLGGIIGTTKAASLTDEQTTAQSLAQSQMEWAQNSTYIPGAVQYTPAALPEGKDYVGYAANITAAALHSPDDGIQKLTVTIERFGEQVAILEGYKVDR